MTNWMNLLPEVFPQVRKTFGVESKVAVGSVPQLHSGVSSGTIIAMKGIKTEDEVVWTIPSVITKDGLIAEYSLNKKEEVFVYPEYSNDKNIKEKEIFVYLISIDPCPGLEESFELINESQLTGLLAHELAEIIATDKIGGYHLRITCHGLSHPEVDKIAVQRGYANQVSSYLKFLLSNVESIYERPPEINSFLDMLIATTSDRERVIQACRRELEQRICSIGGSTSF